MGWRGLWMTKNIEGTVDDDIAAKLAIGEGRQVLNYTFLMRRSFGWLVEVLGNDRSCVCLGVLCGLVVCLIH